MKSFLLAFLLGALFLAGCVQQAAEAGAYGELQSTASAGPTASLPSVGRQVNAQRELQAQAEFSCENEASLSTRGYVLLMGLADHRKQGWVFEKGLMEKDPKARFAIIYDQDETLGLQAISEKFLADMHSLLEAQPVEELVIFGASAGGVTASYSIARLNFSGRVALHTLSSPIKGYDLTGFRGAFIGDRKGYLRDIAIGFGPFDAAGPNVKAYHHKTVTDSVLKAYCGALGDFCDVFQIQNNNLKGSREFYYPQYDHNPLMRAVIPRVLKCYNPSLDLSSISENAPALGDMCVGQEACKEYCKSNLGRCKEYCRDHPENALCQKPFEFEGKLDKQAIPLPPASSPTATASIEPTNAGATPSPLREEARGNKACQGSGPVKLSFPPIRVEEILTIVPMGQMGGGHVTPTDHQYWHTPDWHAGEFHDILSPAKGVITLIQHATRPVNNFPNSSLGDDYRIVIHHSCTVYSIFIHPKKLAPRVLEKAGELKQNFSNYVNVPVEAGEVVAYATATDFSVHNTETKLKGFVTPSLYTEEWKIHTVDPFDYFDEPLKSNLLAKSLRSAEPRGGKIDFDVEGKLVGNWFLKGTNGYAGGGTGDYWKGHLSFAYNHIDPSAVMVSVGDYAGESSRQFAVRGNAPDPASVGVETGLVNYELVNLEYFTPDGSYWNRRSFVAGLKAKDDAVVQGVALVQMLENRKLKLELFPGKKASEVQGFTQNALSYER